MAVWTAEEKQNFRNAHPCAMPKKQANHNYPHADVKGYFDAIFASDYPEYKGMVPIATKCGGSVRIITSVPAERIGEWVEMMHISVRQDYYGFIENLVVFYLENSGHKITLYTKRWFALANHFFLCYNIFRYFSIFGGFLLTLNQYLL